MSNINIAKVRADLVMKYTEAQRNLCENDTMTKEYMEKFNITEAQKKEWHRMYWGERQAYGEALKLLGCPESELRDILDEVNKQYDLV